MRPSPDRLRQGHKVRVEQSPKSWEDPMGLQEAARLILFLTIVDPLRSLRAKAVRLFDQNIPKDPPRASSIE